MTKKLQILLISSAALLSACATTSSQHARQAIKAAPANDIQLAEVKAEPNIYIGTPVRWGGKVLKSEAITTDQGNELIRVEVLQRELDNKARPKNSNDSDGRFVAYIPQPEKKIRSLKNHFITVVGEVSKTEKMQINKNNSVTLPVLDSQDYYVWHRNDYRSNRNIHFGLLYGSPFYWSGHHHSLYPSYRYYPHGHRLHVHSSYCL